MTDRRERVQAAVRDAGLAAAALVSPPSMAYVCGFRPNPHERLIALVVPATGPLRLVVPALEAEAAAAHVPAGTEVFAWRDEDGPADAAAHALAGIEGGLGIEKTVLTVAYHELLGRVAPTAGFVDCGPLVEGLRLRKDEAEVEAMRRAARIVDRVLERLVPELAPGRTEAELVARVAELCREEGADGLAFGPLVLAGPKSALPHGTPDGTPLAEGDLVIVDIGCTAGGYCSDITRTFVCGREPDALQREVYGVVQAAQMAAVATAVEGATPAAVDLAARSVIAAAGYGEAFVHRVGHGLGLEVHEPPSLHARNETPLPAGAAITVEPGIYLPGWGGVRIEDDVIVRPDVPDVLTRAPIGL